jgi:Fe2+ transport system protein B
VLAGLESSGKSALFRAITGQLTGDETNFRGSTVKCRRVRLAPYNWDIIDTPGIRVKDDSQTTQLALKQLREADTVLLVARGTHAKSEIETVFGELVEDLRNSKTALVITFADKAPSEIIHLADFYRIELAIPVIVLNAREVSTANRDELLHAIESAMPPRALSGRSAPEIPVIEPEITLYEHRSIGPIASLFSMTLLFAMPVFLAYLFAAYLQPIIDATVITPLTTFLASRVGESGLFNAILIGNYGVITLGWYSFLWAFPVVVLISTSVALTEEMGLKDRFTAALDPWLRKIGLNGRDLIPVLTGFGCNVVAVLQSRTCSRCTRKNCVSLVAFGSACSYQIGASLSLFNVAGKPWLFAPYLATLFAVGAIHSKIWNSSPSQQIDLRNLTDRAFLQKPTLGAVWWRMRAALRQFLFQAMPIFLIICIVGAILSRLGIIEGLAHTVGPLIEFFGLPRDLAPGIVFSIIRKDGLLVLNQSDGELLKPLSASQLFVLVYLASTLTACLVTLWTVRKELGFRFAIVLASRQAISSIVSAAIISLTCKLV